MRTPIAHLPGRYTPTINGAVQHVRDKAIDAAMDDAESADEIERFRMLSSRGRMDKFWCRSGYAPKLSRRNFRGPEILAAFQQAESALGAAR